MRKIADWILTLFVFVGILQRNRANRWTEKQREREIGRGGKEKGKGRGVEGKGEEIFKELVHMIVGAVKFEIHRAGWQKNSGGS